MPVFILIAVVLGMAFLPPHVVRPSGGEITMTNGTAPDMSGLEGAWRVTAIGDASIPPEARIDMTFGEGRVWGIAGCSGYSATATTEGDELRLGMIDFGATECATQIMQAGSDFVRALGMSSRFEVGADGKLTLYSANIPLVFAEREGAGQP